MKSSETVSSIMYPLMVNNDSLTPNGKMQITLMPQKSHKSNPNYEEAIYKDKTSSSKSSQLLFCLNSSPVMISNMRPLPNSLAKNWP
jgi:hypothetical protein